MKAFLDRSLLVTTFLIAATLFTNVVAHASSAIVAAGQPVTLNTTADGTAPFSYQWYKDGSILTGATNSTYAISSFQAANAGTYYSVVSNSAGSTTSDNAVLTLDTGSTAAPAFTNPVISWVIA